MRLTRSTGPTSEPVTVAEAKAQAVIEGTTDDDLIARFVSVAREQLEDETGRALMTQTWVLTLDSFPDEDVIYLPRPPLASVTSIAYVDTAGSSQTWSSDEYDVDATSDVRKGRVTPAYGYSWPSTRDQAGAVTITYVAGYGAAGDVPEQLKQAIVLLVSAMYEHREASEYTMGGEIKAIRGPTAYDRLIAKYEVDKV